MYHLHLQASIPAKQQPDTCSHSETAGAPSGRSATNESPEHMEPVPTNESDSPDAEENGAGGSTALDVAEQQGTEQSCLHDMQDSQDVRNKPDAQAACEQQQRKSSAAQKSAVEQQDNRSSRSCEEPLSHAEASNPDQSQRTESSSTG
jgi:hypothetical protein